MREQDFIFTRLTDVSGHLQRLDGPAWDSKPLHHRSVEHTAQMYAEWAQLPEGRITATALRYTGAVRKWQAEHDLEALRDFLGFATIQATRKWVKGVIG